MPTFGSLFAGIGGIDLGLERAGWTGRWQVEWDEWCRTRLTDRWPDVRKYGDITDVDWSGVERVDLLAGGFPCQPVSVAGRQAAQEDARWLWPEFHRAIRSLRPGLVLVENVPNLLAVGDGSAFGDILGDLATSGYDTEWDCIPAAAVGAPHERDRVFIVAYPGRGGVRVDGGRGQAHGPRRAPESQEDQRQRSGHPAGDRGASMGDAEGDGRRSGRTGGPVGASARQAELAYRAMADSDSSGLEGRIFHPERAREWFAGPRSLANATGGRREWRRATTGPAGRSLDLSAGPSQSDQLQREPEPGLGRAPDGLPSGLDHCWPAPPGPQYDWEPPRTVAGRVPDRVRRLKACGNAVVPQVVEVIGRLLLEVMP